MGKLAPASIQARDNRKTYGSQNMIEQLSLLGNAPLSLMPLLYNLGVGVILSLILSWHFKRFGSTLSNRQEFALVFPFILLTTVLIISIVKSSLALSLGLVGALSIVRFRTPIKEPEELAYLFIAIGMGLGLGAEQTLATFVAGLSILGAMALFKWKSREQGSRNLYLSIDWHADADDPPERYLDQLNGIIGKHVLSSDLRRFDVRENSTETTYVVDIAGPDKLTPLINDLRHEFPSIGITLLDQSQLPSV